MSSNASSVFAQKPAGFRGALWRPGDTEYGHSRAIFNMRTDKAQPAAILHPLDDKDVAVAARVALETGTPIALRSGGHGIDGSAMPDGAIVIALGAFKRIDIDAREGRVRLGTGVLLGEMDTALERHRLCVPAGTVSSTGIAGLCLGGGVGFNSRRFGATVDSLVACDVVTLDGRTIRASAEEHPDLFWALRGGGGNFGIVTGFEFLTHALPALVSAAFIFFPLESGGEVLPAVRDYMLSAPRELCVIGALTQCPPLPPVPAHRHGENVVILVVVHTGATAVAERLFSELSKLGPAIATMAKPDSWSHVNRLLDAVAPYGRRAYTKGGYVTDLTDDIVAIALRHAALAPPPTGLPAPSTVQNFLAMGGAISEDVAECATAFSREGAGWLWEAVSQWDSREDDQAFEAWTHALLEDMQPHLRSNGYINLTTDQGPEWRRGVWGAPSKYDRLLEAKTAWDPGNLLRFNKNIPPRAPR